MTDFIDSGECGPGVNAQNEILDARWDKYSLQDQAWRLVKPWYEPIEYWLFGHTKYR